MAEFTPIRHGLVEGRPIKVFDNLISAEECQRLDMAFRKASFVRNEIAKPETENVRHWALDVSLEQIAKTPLLDMTLQAAESFSNSGESYRAYRTYCNYSGYGDMLFTHTDCLPGSRELTALWFLCSQWDHEWGGETLFFNDKNDAEFVVSPKPGRLVMFDGSIIHAGRPPSRICFEPRFTFAFKLELV